MSQRTAAPWVAVVSSLLMVGTPGMTQVHNAETPLAAQIDRLVAPLIKADLLSGVILVTRGDRTIFERAYGFASWELRVPNTLRTRFGIASISKPMTEALVSVLVQRGRLDLDAPVELYLPGFPKGPKSGVPTVRELLNHRAGVPHRVTSVADETQVLHPADIVERVKAHGLLFEPGTQELYSSAGFTCLARVIEVVEESPFEVALADFVFKPARMKSARSETGRRLMPNKALPYQLVPGDVKTAIAATPYKDLRFLTGAGSVFATPMDLLHFVRAAQAGVFGSELRDWSYRGDAKKWRGWYGRTNGYEASVDILPSENLVFVFLSNLQSAANWQLRQRIQDLLLGRPVVSMTLPPPRVQSFEPTTSVVGLYGDRGSPVEIAIEDGELVRDENYIYPIAGNSYYIPVSGSTMRFDRAPDGVIDSVVTIWGNGRETVLPKLPPR